MDIANITIGIVSLVVSLGGFTTAIWQIRRTRSTVEQAKAAANAARDSVLQITSVVDLTQASGQIDQLKELHRNSDLRRALDKYTPLRQMLTDARSRMPSEKARIFNRAIRQLVLMEQETTRTIQEEGEIDANRYHGVLLQMQQSLDEARIELEQYVAATTSLEGRLS